MAMRAADADEHDLLRRVQLPDAVDHGDVSSAHRHAAFAACEFIMDYLKTRAPFWKKSLREDGEFWVEAKESDTGASERWNS
jgi:molybdopterin synthase catalytic subunit